MITGSYLNYNPKLFISPMLDEFAYYQLIKDIKKKLHINKIVCEKLPSIMQDNLYIERNRLITEHDDKLLIFAIGNPSSISTLWYTKHNKNYHIDIFNGKCVIINLPIYSNANKIAQKKSHIFNVVFCDFKHYNISKISAKHNMKNFHSHFIII